MSKTIQVTAKVEVPMVPNYLRMTDGQSLPLDAVSDDDLREIGKLWTEALVAKANTRRKRTDKRQAHAQPREEAKA